MRLLGGLAEPAVLPQDPDAPAERPPDRLLAVEACRPVRFRNEDGDANLGADLVHPARMQQKDMIYTTHKGKKILAKTQPQKKIHKKQSKIWLI